MNVLIIILSLIVIGLLANYIGKLVEVKMDRPMYI